MTLFQVRCSGSGFQTQIKQVEAAELPMSVDVCNLAPDSRVGCAVAALTSNNQTFNEGPYSDDTSSVTYRLREYPGSKVVSLHTGNAKYGVL